MKRIAVLTWFGRGRNYGQTLQAFALYRTLNKMGHECELLSYGKNGPRLSDEEINQLSGNSRDLQIKFTAFIKRHLNYSVRLREKREVERYLKGNPFDLVLCGSDQIWNPLISREDIYTYMLDFDMSSPKIAYAASMIDIRLISEYDKYPETGRLILNLNAVSVRENSARLIVQQLTAGSVNPAVVLDPTMLLTQKEWTESVEIPQINRKGFIFCYMYYVTENQKKLIQRLAQTHGCKTIIFSDLLKMDLPEIAETHVELAESVSVEMFLSLIHDAEAVVTDSFHGTAFSIQFEKDFWAVESTRDKEELIIEGRPKSHIDRLATLLEKAGLTSRLLRFGAESKADLTSPINYVRAKNMLTEERKISLAWLERAIND